jgi:membrane protein implicated in regulation of membrane protease activity
LIDFLTERPTTLTIEAMALAWLVLSVILIAIELHHVAFYAMFGALGAAVGAIVAYFAPSALTAQVASALVATGVGVMFARPYVSHAFAQQRGGRVAVGVHGGLVGETVFTTDVVSEKIGGHVLLAGETWLAVSGDHTTLPPGTSVIVISVRGTTLTVMATDGLFE